MGFLKRKVCLFASIKNCYAHDCQDLGISVQVLNAVVENCVVENCGNNNISNLATYGINNSYNAGGGYSTELLEAKFVSDRKHVNVTYINCVARNCYNYGFYSDCGGVRYIGCKVSNITPTYVAGLPVEERFGTNQLRAGAAIVYAGTYVGSMDDIVTENCHFESVSFLFKCQSTRKGLFYNCTIKSVIGNPVYDVDDIQNAKIVSCELDAAHTFNLKYKYIGCFNPLGDPLPAKTFTTANRPNLTLLAVGDYGGFDTTINKPIYKKNASTWVDATGATV